MISSLKKLWFAWLALMAMLAAPQLIGATTVIMPTDDDMIIGARAIVRARVLRIDSSFDQGMVFTYIALRVREVLKGQISARRIVIKEAGGVAEGHMTVIHGAPQFSPDEEVILYLSSWPDGSLRTYQMFLGKFSIKPDPETGKLIAKRDDPGPYVDIIEQGEGLNPSLGGGRRVVTNRMELGAYVDMVRRRVAETRQQSEQFQKIHYNGAPLFYEPPEYAEKEMSGQLSPQFSLLGPMRWFEPDSGQPVIFYVRPDGAPNSNILSDVQAAAGAWSSVPGASIVLSIGGTTAQCRETTGTNTIRFDNCDGSFQPTASCSGILALGGGSASFETKVVNGTTFRRMVSGFVSLNPYASCYFSNPCNVREVLTHELGHAIGLGHSEFQEATMYSLAHFDGRCASLRQDDQNGAVFIYPGSGSGQPIITSGSPLPSGMVGMAYSFTFSATGGTPPYSWSVAAGALPPGLNLSSNGQLSGTPSSAGNYSFTVRVADSASQSAQKDFSIVISSPGTPELDSQFISQNVPTTVQAGQPFNVSMTWLNTGSQVWSEANQIRIGSQNPPNNTTWGGNRVILPPSTQIGPGQQLSVTFTAFAPSTPGNYNFQWQMVKEGVGFFGQLSQNVVITVAGGFSIATTQLPAGTIGLAYSAQLAAAGGTPPYSWSLILGSLPPGLSLNSSGVISGTPSAVGIFTFTVGVTDSQSRSAQRQLSLRINPPPPTIESPSLLEATVGVAFNHQLVASGGTPPYSWQLISGQLPGGLSLNSSTGVISGTPSFAGTFPFIVQVTDSASQSAQKSMQIRVAQQSLSITTDSLAAAVKGLSYSQQLSVVGGAPPYSWSLAAGSLPPGLALNSSTGVISGTPSQKGTFSFTISVRDQSQQSASRQFQLLVVGPDQVPSIINVKYKPGPAKLIVTGENFDPAARLFIGGREVSPRFIEPTRIVVKPMPLAPGQYDVRVVNPGGIASNTFRVTIN